MVEVVRPSWRPRPIASGICVALAAALVWASPASACSVEDSYRIPTNFELVGKAELIVLGRIVGTEKSEGTEPFGDVVLIEPIRVLKGRAPSGRLKLFGETSWNGQPIPSMPSVLASSHFSAGLGACVRIFYPTEGLVLAMFETGQTGLMQVRDPWARAVEDVEAEDGIWVRAVEEYLAIQQAAAGGDLRAAVETRRRQLLGQRDVAAQAMADDLGDHLRRSDEQAGAPAFPRWAQFDTPQAAGAAIVHGPESSAARAILLCRKDAPAIEVHSVGLPDATAMTLLIGEHRFGAEAVGPGKLETLPTTEGRLRPTAELFAVMARETSDSGIGSAAGTTTIAPPLDILQKLALRCQALLEPGSSSMQNN